LNAPSRRLVTIANLRDLADGVPAAAEVGAVDLVVIRRGDEVRVLYGRCPHRGARLADGHLEGARLTCAFHGWSFCCDTGASDLEGDPPLQRFEVWVEPESGAVRVDAERIEAWRGANPEAFHREEYIEN